MFGRFKEWRRRRAVLRGETPDTVPQVFNPREGAEIFALRGDNSWGNSITWTQKPAGDGKGRVYGWTHVTPQPGDILAVKMESGQWGRFIFVSVSRPGDPPDMFFANVVGAYGYIDPELVPPLASPVGRSSGSLLIR